MACPLLHKVRTIRSHSRVVAAQHVALGAVVSQREPPLPNGEGGRELTRVPRLEQEPEQREPHRGGQHEAQEVASHVPSLGPGSGHRETFALSGHEARGERSLRYGETLRTGRARGCYIQLCGGGGNRTRAGRCETSSRIAPLPRNRPE
jgi:hypothetical protein